jgi:hypothetical protein
MVLRFHRTTLMNRSDISTAPTRVNRNHGFSNRTKNIDFTLRLYIFSASFLL